MTWRRVGVAVLGATALLGAVVVAQWPSGCNVAGAAAAPIRIMPMGDSITAGGGPEHSYRAPLQAHLDAAGVSYDFVGSYGNIVPPGGEPIWSWPDESQSSYSGPFDKDFEGHGGFQAGQPLSVVGYRDHMLAQMVPTDIPQFQPDVVLLHIGTNDYLGGWTIHGPWHGPNGEWDQREAYAARNVIDLIDAIHQIRPQTWIVVSAIGRPGINNILDGLAVVSNLVQAAVLERASAGRNVSYLANTYADITAADLADAVHPNQIGNAKMARTWFEALQPLLGGGNPAPAPVQDAGAPPTPAATPAFAPGAGSGHPVPADQATTPAEPSTPTDASQTGPAGPTPAASAPSSLVGIDPGLVPEGAAVAARSADALGAPPASLQHNEPWPPPPAVLAERPRQPAEAACSG